MFFGVLKLGNSQAIWRILADFGVNMLGGILGVLRMLGGILGVLRRLLAPLVDCGLVDAWWHAYGLEVPAAAAGTSG